MSAQRALDLIISALVLMESIPSGFMGMVQLTAYDDEFLDKLFEHEREHVRAAGVTSTRVPKACEIAAKASFRRAYVHALTKFRFSSFLVHTDIMDLDPYHSGHIPVSPFPIDHIFFCHAIISAYSVIEELGLELRASSKNPTFIKGAWNPQVRRDLESRLTKAGIDLSRDILWTIRGPRRKTEKARPVPIQVKPEWAKGPMVRDAKIKVIDAIAQASWLRSKVASHKLQDLVGSLSRYDVDNVQDLAQRLFLESLGFRA